MPSWLRCAAKTTNATGCSTKSRNTKDLAISVARFSSKRIVRSCETNTRWLIDWRLPLLHARWQRTFIRQFIHYCRAECYWFCWRPAGVKHTRVEKIHRPLQSRGSQKHVTWSLQKCNYTVSQKTCCRIFAITSSTLLTDFENSFTVGNSNELSTKWM